MLCEVCGSNQKLIKHHTSYQPEAIQLICHSCHQKLHKNGKAPIRPENFTSKYNNFVTIAIHEETKEILDHYTLPRESWDETISRILRCWGEVKGMIPLTEKDLEFLSVEHRRHGFTSVDETMNHLFNELAVYRVTYGELEAAPLGKRGS